MKKLLCGLLVLGACLFSVPGYSSETDAIRMVYSAYDFTLDFQVAIEKKFFDKVGLDLTPVTIQGGSANIISTLHKGEVSGCFLASSSALVAQGKGIPLVQVAGIGIQSFDFYTLKDSPIHSIEDFEGKKIGTFPKPSGPWLALQADLDTYGIDAQVMFMKSYSSMLSSVLTGQLDAGVFVSYVLASNPDTLKKVHTSTISKYLYNSCGWWFKPEFIQAHPRAVEKFVKGLTLGREFIRDHRKKAVDILVKNTKLNPADFKGELSLPHFDLPVTIYQYGLEKTNDIIMKYGLTDKKVDTASMVEPRFAKVVDQPY